VCRPTLYNWKNQLLSREASASKKRHQDSGATPKQKDLTELHQH
jgi:putative transposase